MNKIYSLIIIANLLSVTVFAQIKTGAEQINKYLPAIKNKRVALVVNQTSLVGQTHLLDTLIASKINIQKVFSPEHGFRGDADAGALINNSRDKNTGIEIISLYGRNKKPSKDQLKNIDIVIFDIQDVGVRFYTYISTLHYVMEACAENRIKLIVLDRPNPNAFYIDGPVMEDKHKSFVGMHKVPIVYGMTIGEYANMINGEDWINKKVDLKIIKLQNWKHNTIYHLPIKPSPNLPNEESILLYPSLCFFEGTVISAGRGTQQPFQLFGMPKLKNTNYSFKPISQSGAKHPKFEGQLCRGLNLIGKGKNIYTSKQIDLSYLIFAYNNVEDKNNFFNPFFEKLSGTDSLRKQIIKGIPEQEIRKSWKPDIDKFKLIREKYLLYN